MTRGRPPSADGWITVGVKLRQSDVRRLDLARAAVSRSEWIRRLVLAACDLELNVKAPAAGAGKNVT